MKSPVHFVLTGLASAVLLAGCGDSKGDDANADGGDPALTGALGDQIMVDPELSGQGGAAAGAGGANVELPPEQRSPEAIAAARQEAATRAGGSLTSAPSPTGGSVASLVENAATAAQVAATSRSGSADCASKVKYSMNWVSKLPAALSVYPRGAVQEAAGTDDDGCSLRVVSFVTPVATKDVVDFYYTRASKAGYNADYRKDGNDHVLGGAKGGNAYLIYTRKLGNGLTEVDLIASGN